MNNIINKLIINRFDSRNILIKALKEAEERLIIVCPWLTTSAINDELISLIEACLKRNVSIDIGWGNLGDLKGCSDINSSLQENENLKILREKTKDEIIELFKTKTEKWKYNGLEKLQSLEKNYPNNFNLIILGTHEKYLVCDKKFLLIGSHNLLTSGESSKEREIGVYTIDETLIEEAIKSFDYAETLHDNSILQYIMQCII